MSRTEKVELTTLCMLTDGDRILLQNRVKKDWRGYTLPGGHIEPGESIVDAAIREMKEETGLTIFEPKLVGIKQFPIEGGRYLVFLFKAENYTGQLVSSDEGKMEWIKISELSNIKTVNDLEELLEVMNSDKLTEFIYVIEEGKWIIHLR